MKFFKQPFGSILQPVLLSVLLLGGLLVVQPWVKGLYQAGLVLIIGAALLEIGAGNIPPDASFQKSLLILVFSLIVVAAVFSLGMFLVPTLVALGR
jgi:hypothetical protein